MINQYKVVISNKNLYKEILLPTDVTSFSIGTSIECNYRLRKELFFDSVRLDFINDNGRWSVMCSENVFISIGDARKLMTLSLNHGDGFVVSYQNSNNVVFDIEFSVAFETRKINYDRKIAVKGVDHLSIGTDSRCNICIRSEYLANDYIELRKSGNGLAVQIGSTSYGVYHNGNKAVNGEIIKNGDFFAISDFSFYYRNDSIWTDASADCKVNGLSFKDYKPKNNYPRFTRNTRVKNKVDDSDIEILDPPIKPTKPKDNILMSLLSSMGMLLSAGVMALVGGGRMIIFSAITGGMAIVTTIVGIVQGKKDYKKEVKERIEKYNSYISRKKTEVEKIRSEEKDLLDTIYISKEKKLDRFNGFSGDLFDRRLDDEDFLCVRFGTGEVESLRKINYKKQEKLEIADDLQELPEKVSHEYKYVHEAPVYCNLRNINAMGIVGNDKQQYEFLKSIIADVSARHFYSDIKIFLIVESENAPLVDNFRFSPFLDGCVTGCRNIVCDEDSKKIIYEFLYNELSRRAEAEKKQRPKEHYLIMFYDLFGVTKHPLSKFIDKAKELSATFVFFDDDTKKIPMGCEKIVNIIDDEKACLINTFDAEKTEFVYDKFEDKEIYNIVKILAPVKTDEISLEGTLTKNINLFTLLNIFGVEDLDYKSRWESTKVNKSMSVPLGVSKSGTVYLDLHDKAHGPHGLVAGTTGSGKSEILQTYILSIATFFHPYEVAFVIIDFKGGGMVNQFKNLPHLLGAITNIDGKEIDRSLKSIKAELQKRQRYFAEAEVNHIDAYISKYKNGEVKNPLPHLIIIVDEFAELKAEQPDFMKELISAARIGRSLGVHLILATQKPAGQVDDQIWSNSRFKLCLKVQGPEDSNEVLKSPLAAEIKEPGRAYLQVGNNEIFELFQSAYSGASEKDVDNNVKSFKVSSVDRAGRRKTVFEQKENKTENDGRTQLDAIVDSVNMYCKENNIERLANICLPSLNKKIDYVYMADKYENNKVVDIGVYDDPDNQYQGSTLLDIANKNTLIVGSAQYGKTNFLQLIIKEIAERNTVNEANIYILDFGSMVLKIFEKLHHVGGVVCSSDDEKLKNLFKLLLEQIEIRKEKIVSVGVSSFSAYCEAGYKDIPHIYVVVDNMTALMELYLENDDSFLNIIREGIGVGITVIVANSQTGGINFRYMTNFANKIALYCNDSSEYSNVFGHTTLKPDEIPGRAILDIDKRILECQTYIAFKGEKEHERAKEIQEFIERRNELNKDVRAKQIPYIPNVLTSDDIIRNYDMDVEGYDMPIGLSYSEVAPFILDISKIGALGLCGKEKRGHYTFVSNILHKLEDIGTAKVYIFDDVSRKYNDLKDLSIVKKYTLNPADIEGIIKGWIALLENRYNSMLNEEEPYDNDLLLLIIQNNEVASHIARAYDLLNNYKDVVGKYKTFNVGVIYANYHNNVVPYDAPEPLKMLKVEKHMICFDDLDNLKVFDVNYEDIRANKKRLQVGDAYYIEDNMVTKLKLIKH